MNKKVIGMIFAVGIGMISLAGCSSNSTNNQVQEKQTEKSSQAGFGEMTKAADMLYEVTYDNYSSEIPDDSKINLMQGEVSACSGVRNGNFVGRNFDYFMNQSPTFVIRTTAKEGRYATIGVGRLAKINSADVEAGLSQDKKEIIPWSILDGINEKGLVCNTNVVYKIDEGEVPHTGTNPDAPIMNATFMPRALLDNCATVDEAIEYIKNHNITPLPSEDLDIHIMISDPEKTCVVEFINNEVVAKENEIMTNYLVNTDDIPEHPTGLERMGILEENYDEGNSMEGMYNLMKRVRYTNTYDATNKWYSEFGTTFSQLWYLEISATYPQIQNVTEEADKQLKELQKKFESEKEYVKENGFRETTDWWDTVHNTIYDIENKKIWVTVHERYEEGPHEFSLH